MPYLIFWLDEELICVNHQSNVNIIEGANKKKNEIVLQDSRVCNGAKKRVPGGIVCIDGLASDGVMVVWYLHNIPLYGRMDRLSC